MSEWIKVSDGLPKGDEFVLCTCHVIGRDFYYAHVCTLEQGVFRNDEGLIIRVTHWMPLPKPPQD